MRAHFTNEAYLCPYCGYTVQGRAMLVLIRWMDRLVKQYCCKGLPESIRIAKKALGCYLVSTLD